MSRVRLGCLLILGALASSVAAVMLGWKFVASDACLDSGGAWRDAAGVCLGLS